jgi:hypothetical protein
VSELFEVISKEEFESSVAVAPDVGVGKPNASGVKIHPHELELTWCEFCKGYYIEEYHYGDREQ